MKNFQANTDKVAWRVVDGEAVIVHADSSAYYGLNAAGTLIWEAIAAAPLSAEDIAARLGARYALARDAARADVQAFLGSLNAEGLLQETADGSGRADVSTGDQKEHAPGGYEPPALARFGELEQLVLSGE